MKPLLTILLVPAVALAEPGPPPRALHADRDGDALPAGAVARLGSTRFREINATRLALTADGTQAVCSDNASVRFWDLKTGKLVRCQPLPPGFVGLVSPDGRRAVHFRETKAWSGETVADVWDLSAGKRTHSLAPGDRASFQAVAMSPDGMAVGTIEAGEKENLVRVWDLRTGTDRLVARGRANVDYLWFTEGGRNLLVWYDGEERVQGFDSASGAEAFRLKGVRSFLAVAGGRHCLTDSGPAAWQLVDAATGRWVRRGPDQARYVHLEPVGLAPDGERLAFQSHDDVVVWDLRQAKEASRCRVEGTLGAFGPGGGLVVMSQDGLHVFDARGRRVAGPDPARELPRLPKAFGWLADGKTVTAITDENLRIWFDAATGAVTRRAPDSPWPPASRLAGCCWPTPPRDLGNGWGGPDPYQAGRPYMGWFGPEEGLVAARFQEWLDLGGPQPPYRFNLVGGPDRIGADYMAASSSAGPSQAEVAVHDRHTRQRLWKVDLAGPTDVAFSPDGRRLATLEPDRIRLWDAATGREVLARRVPVPAGPRAGVPAGRGLAFSPDGCRLAVGEWDGTILIWDVSVPEPGPAPLTADELTRLWDDLRSRDAQVAWAAVFRLTARPGDAVPFLIDRMRPVRPVAPDAAKRLLADLDAPAYRTREAAMRRALDWGDAAGEVVREALREAAGEDLGRRLENLRDRLGHKSPPAGDDLQQLRALFVLERAGTPAARAKIEDLTTGLPLARVTAEAKRARDRQRERDGPGKD